MPDPGRPGLYPLRFQEILRDYSFGDRWIVREFAKAGLPENHRVGETWEVCDRPKESSKIINGALAGTTLRQALDRFGPALVGSEIAERFGTRFPLLIKFLDATHPLGEQVHTNDELTKARGVDDYSGKTEAWYMVKTRPGATVFCGNRPGLTRDGLLAAFDRNAAVECMQEHPAAPGDLFLLYAGTMHHSHGGLLFYEIMQNSDVYVGLRFGQVQDAQERRRKIELAAEAVHLEEGFDCRARPVTISAGPNKRTFVCACAHFALERLDLWAPYALTTDGRRFLVLTVIAGCAEVAWGGGVSTILGHRDGPRASLPAPQVTKDGSRAGLAARQVETLLTGQSCLIPACLKGAVIRPVGRLPGRGASGCSVLKGYVPDLIGDIIAPLRRRGIDDDAICALGGRTELNGLARLL